MVYVFTFLGEFGYELFNWQGVVRKFSRTIDPSDRIVCCGRANVSLLYETASLYIDISDIDLYRDSQACCYWAVVPGSSHLGARENRALDKRLRRALERAVAPQLPVPKSRWLPWTAKRGIRYMFSSSSTRLNGCSFGCDPALEREGNIYEGLNLAGNLYKRIEPDLRIQSEVERRIGFPLTEPYLLIQGRARQVVIRSREIVPKDELITALSKGVRVVLLSFDTGRALDSRSEFDPSLPCIHYACGSLAEQVCLIHFAKRCLFFTEGDFGSHIYIPPFMGKDVEAIAPRSVFELATAPVDFWNRNVFRFGGQIIPRISEDVLSSRDSMMGLVDDVLAR